MSSSRNPCNSPEPVRASGDPPFLTRVLCSLRRRCDDCEHKAQTHLKLQHEVHLCALFRQTFVVVGARQDTEEGTDATRAHPILALARKPAFVGLPFAVVTLAWSLISSVALRSRFGLFPSLRSTHLHIRSSVCGGGDPSQAIQFRCLADRTSSTSSASSASFEKDHSKQSQICRLQLLAKPQRGRNRRSSSSSPKRRRMPHTVGAPPPTFARQGREQQKYGDDGSRLVAGCIPIRYLPGISGAAGVRICLISSRGGKGYVFPKGGWETDESVESAARRETVEEAGLRGVLEPLLGQFEFNSGKAGRARCVAFMFAMSVSEELETWPEMKQRERRWCTIEEAYSLARMEWMKAALRTWVGRKGWNQLLETLGEADNGAVFARGQKSNARVDRPTAGSSQGHKGIVNDKALHRPANIAEASETRRGDDQDAIFVAN